MQQTSASESDAARRSWGTFGVPVLAGLVLSAMYWLPAKAVWFDDPYIFFRYVKNLAAGNGLSFNDGELSFGATSILWPLLVAVPARVTGWEASVLTQWMSILLYCLSAGVLAIALQRVVKQWWIGPLIGVMYVAYPSAVKVGLSGMEVGLLLLILSLFLWASLQPEIAAWQMGLLAGCAYLTRPDAILLVPIVLMWIVARVMMDRGAVRTVFQHAGLFMLCFGLVVMPWLTYLYAQTGRLLPATQAGRMILWAPIVFGVSYDEYLALGAVERFGRGLGQMVTFFTDFRQVVLLSGLAGVVVLFCRRYSWDVRGTALMAALYATAMPIIYAWNFPLPTFRYFTGMLLFGMFTLAIVLDWLVQEAVRSMPDTLAIQRSAPVVVVFVVGMSYLGLHYRSFPNYLEQVEQQAIRVETGKWLRDHTPPNVTIATEPIGGLGYYSDRYMLDMGALVMKEAQDLMPNGCSNPTELGLFLQATNALYLADCSGLCLGKPALESAGIGYETVFSLDSTQKDVVSCNIHQLRPSEEGRFNAPSNLDQADQF